MIKVLLFAFFIPLTVSGSSLKSILDKIDKLYRSKTSKAKMEMTIVHPKFTRTLKMDIWTKSLDYTFVRIRSPRKDKGISTLKRKKEMWNFFPKINKVLKVPPSMMMGSWMGSDFTNDDLVKENTLQEDYDSKLIKSSDKEYSIELTPKAQSISLWGKIILKANKEPLYPLSQEFYDESGKLIRTMFFKDLGHLGGRKIPKTMELVSHIKKGNKTIVTYTELVFDLPLKDSIFGRKNLQKRQ